MAPYHVTRRGDSAADRRCHPPAQLTPQTINVTLVTSRRTPVGHTTAPVGATRQTVKKFVTFLQPGIVPKYPFFSLYEAGYVAEWFSNYEAFDPERSRCDILVCDHDHDPDRATDICRSMKAGRKRSKVVFTSTGRFAIPSDAVPDAVLPLGLTVSEFVQHLKALFPC